MSTEAAATPAIIRADPRSLSFLAQAGVVHLCMDTKELHD
ncbi:hypothetical protein TSACC_3231 [Terrimicrobium sacchariphilum]|jgi:hypothetical protein|uniref:Uncharacterized protein n=1 Tax=Terrimicrobium sacchariphilum TaxID=690879 RepID=A0A146GEV5_TERSA|nr:hypothetical protein TSACC_3231 [Terrimicrobium sacchariphilum]